MKVSGTATDGEILNDMVLTETMGYHGEAFLVIKRHDLLLVKPYVETRGGLVKFTDIKIVNKHIGKDGAKKLGVFHDAKVTLYS